MVITATELKANIGRYLDTAKNEDILITRKGKIIARISSPPSDKLALLDSLAGVAEGTDITLEEARSERLARE